MGVWREGSRPGSLRLPTRGLHRIAGNRADKEAEMDGFWRGSWWGARVDPLRFLALGWVDLRHHGRCEGPAPTHKPYPQAWPQRRTPLRPPSHAHTWGRRRHRLRTTAVISPSKREAWTVVGPPPRHVARRLHDCPAMRCNPPVWPVTRLGCWNRPGAAQGVEGRCSWGHHCHHSAGAVVAVLWARSL